MWEGRFDAWGNEVAVGPTESGGPEIETRFPGQVADAESGLRYNRHRYYDPDTGAYTRPDPIGLNGGPRMQSYVADPNQWVDPLGLTKCSKRLAVQRRQEQMLRDNVGYNVSPESWFTDYPGLGRYGTFLTGRKAFLNAIGKSFKPNNAYKVGDNIRPSQVRRLETRLGLEPGSLNDGFRITEVTDISARSPRSPLEGNRFFRGPGNGLPGGGPELVVDPIPTTPWPPP